MFTFKTKAQNLEQLDGGRSDIVIPTFRHFSRSAYQASPDTVLERLRSTFNGPVIVRSSALGEDSGQDSLAGAFESVICTDPSNLSDLRSSIEEVLLGMTSSRIGLAQDRVLVQHWISEVSMSGVIFSRDLATGSPYIVINYDDSSGSTDSVTSGHGEISTRTLWIFREETERIESERFGSIVEKFLWLERATSSSLIDVEFALDRDGSFCLLQVRPLVGVPQRPELERLISPSLLNSISDYCRTSMSPNPNLLGDTTLLGQMPDWNPAEIIGRTPRRLARTLYEHVITDSIWAEARQKIGYRNVSAVPLMCNLAGQPYIDVRVSMNSFLPNATDPTLGARLVDAWVKRLSANPYLHDKVEFEVATPSYRFDLKQFYSRHYPEFDGVPHLSEYFGELRSLAMGHIRDTDGSRAAASRAVDELERWQSESSEAGTHQFPISTALSICRRLGTRPFAVHARHAFAARALIQSLEVVSHLEPGFLERLQQQVPTIATRFTESIGKVKDEIDLSNFLSEFGHLRPGTYEVTSLRYDDMPREFFLEAGKDQVGREWSQGPVASEFRQELQNALQRAGETDLRADELITYLEISLRERERAKFVFSRTISEVLRMIETVTQEVNLSREDVSHLTLASILEYEKGVAGNSYATELQRIAVLGRREFEVSRGVRLPTLICNPEEVWIVPVLISQPNFITTKQVVAPLSVLDGSASDWQIPLEGTIAAIENADPGFDWIFARGISGLITLFGGANSHMAIRCAEFGLPAAIGCGDELFDRVRRSSVVELDCSHRIVRPLR